MLAPIRKYLAACWSCCHGTDGLSDVQQIERNVTVIGGNIVIIIVFEAIVLAGVIVEALQ